MTNEYKIKFKLTVLISLGLLASVYFFSWWWDDLKIYNPLYVLLLIFALLYSFTQIYSVWYIILHAKYPVEKPGEKDFTIDVFIPAFNEPLWMVERAVKAVVEIHYPHKTFLLDDGNNIDYKVLADKYKIGYFLRESNENNKAGNINNAIKKTSGQLIAIFDIDHIPAPEYLDKIPGRFEDPKIGAVQILLDHYNSQESFVASACAELNDDFFGPSTLGMNGCGCTTVFGSNSVFRREALVSIGGYVPGLAEDLNTSITLHANGWETDYIPQVLAKGLVPNDLTSFFKQQLKWARGVFDTLFRIYPKIFTKLSFNKHVCYLTRMTYYTAGPIIAFHILMALIALSGLSAQFTNYFASYLYHAIPFLFIFIYTHQFAGKHYRVKPLELGFRLRGIILVFGTWPIYTIAFLYALFGIRLRFMATPKTVRKRKFLKLIMPQILAVTTLLCLFCTNLLFLPFNGYTLIVNAFAIGIALIHIGLFYAAWEGWKRQKESLSNEFDLSVQVFNSGLKEF